VTSRSTLLIAAPLLAVCLAGCAHQGLYEIRNGAMVSVPDSSISPEELLAVYQQVTRDLARTGFMHGIPLLWHMRVQPTQRYRNEFIYVPFLLSFHWSDWTVGNIANIRVTHAPMAGDLVADWPYSWDTNLLLIWQNQHSYYAVVNDEEITLYRDYLGSLFFLPLTRLFGGAREVARIRRAANP